MRLPVLALLLVCACSRATPDPDVEMAPPASGFQLGTEAFDVPAASEVQRCYFFAVPAAPDGGSADPVWIGEVIAAINPGSHHMNVFRVKTIVNLDGDPGTMIDGGECWVSSNWADWPLVMNSQQSIPGQNVVDWTLPGGVAQHPRCGLAAKRLLAASGVVAHLDPLDLGNPLLQAPMHRLDDALLSGSPPHVGLVGGHDECVARGLERTAAFGDPVKEPEVLKPAGWVGLAVPHHLDVQGAVAVEEHCRPQRHGARPWRPPTPTWSG